MKTIPQLVLAVGLICFLSATPPAHAETLATDTAPAIATIPTGLPWNQDNVLKKQLAALTALRDDFKAVMADYNQTPRTGIVVGSSEEATLNGKIAAINRARAAYIFGVNMFNRDIASLPKVPTQNSIPMDLRVQQEQAEFDRMNGVWMGKQKQLIEQRLKEENRWASAFYASLKTGATPLPDKKFSELQPGDVLLISPDGAVGEFIRDADRLTSDAKNSPASHTVLFLKEVNGKKLFLDQTPNKLGVVDTTGINGSHIITEDVFLKTYGKREAQVARSVGLAQPVSEEQAAKLWAAAEELAIKGLKKQQSGTLIRKTNYGPYGEDNMVCSEAARLVLVKAGWKIPVTTSISKKLAGIEYGPSDFYGDRQNFIVSPLALPK